MVFQKFIDNSDIKITSAENEVLKYIEYSIPEIAKKLHLSPNTIKTHIANLREKFKVHSRAELCTVYYRYIIEKQEIDIAKLKSYTQKLKAIIYNLRNNKEVYFNE